MLIHGKERHFKLTIGASAAIAKLCPDGDLSRIEEKLNGTYTETIDFIAKMMVEMSRGYECAKAFEVPTYNPDPLTVEAVYAMTPPDLAEAQREMLAAFGADISPTVEIEESKKNKAAQE